LILIGGAIDTASAAGASSSGEKHEPGILEKIIAASARGKDAVIEIVTAASREPEKVHRMYSEAFNRLGARHCNHLPVRTRKEAADAENIRRLEHADVVFFTGGDQLQITSTIGGTAFHQTLLHRYRKDAFVYAGTSAGAAAAASNMIYSGDSSNALLKGAVEMNSGLGLIESVVTDTHFVTRGRIGRLFQAVVGNPMKTGLGMGENTGVIIEQNNKMTVIGSGSVIVVDGREISDTNLTSVSIDEPISISRLVTHVLSGSDVFYLNENKVELFNSQYKNSI